MAYCAITVPRKMLELNTTPDYFVCHSDNAKEPGLWVGVRPQIRKMVGCWSKSQQWCSFVKALYLLEGNWCKINVISPFDFLGFSDMLLFGMNGIVCHLLVYSCFYIVTNWHMKRRIVFSHHSVLWCHQVHCCAMPLVNCVITDLLSIHWM